MSEEGGLFMFHKPHHSVKRREIDMLHGSLVDKLLLFSLPLALTGIQIGRAHV